MSEQTPPAAHQPPDDPAIFKVLPDGRVLYKTYQQAEQAAQQLKSSQPAGEVAKSAGQAKLGETYLAKDGQTQPYTLTGLMEFQVTGLIVVMLVLCGLSLVCAAIGRLLKSLHGSAAARSIPAPAPSSAKSAPVSGIHPGLTDQQLAVILTAAAQEELGEPVRIKRFRPLNARDMSWSAKGRSDLQSHRLK